MIVEVKLKGIEDLTKTLDGRLRLAAVKKVVQYHTAEVHRKAVEKVPVDTGFLKRSIQIRIFDGGMTGAVQAYADYAGYVEYGTRFMEAQPYMRPAFYEHEQPFLADLARLDLS
ncbi:MAG: HK97 gp10 family phage protein [Bacillota bacterium]|nr:HK97 gp10 family phage protein [Bacillota bacterium]